MNICDFYFLCKPNFHAPINANKDWVCKKNSNNKYAQSSEIKSVFWYPQKLRSSEKLPSTNYCVDAECR